MKHKSEMRSNGITKRYGSTERHQKEITGLVPRSDLRSRSDKVELRRKCNNAAVC